MIELAIAGVLLQSSPAPLSPCAPTAIVFDYCERVPDVEYPGDNGGTITPRPEDIIGTTLLCPDGSYGTVVDMNYTVDCDAPVADPALVEPHVDEPTAPATTAPTVEAPTPDPHPPAVGFWRALVLEFLRAIFPTLTTEA